MENIECEQCSKLKNDITALAAERTEMSRLIGALIVQNNQLRDMLASSGKSKDAASPTSNTPIETLMAEYENEGCDHSNIEWVADAAMRHVSTMEDSQVRCLLYALAQYVKD